jgi:(1->4)-alpha-D-glucan 1-alpha-D-glucosylmutase
MPGIPDFYQGSEFWDLSLVDPDNRRPVDFAARASALEVGSDEPDWTALAATWPHGRIKFALMRRLLALRQRLPDVFANGSYRPIEVLGPDRSEVLAFARVSGRAAVIVAAGRLFARATHRGARWPPGEAWNASLTVGRFSKIASALGHGKVVPGPKLALSDLFDALPVAVLQAQYMPARNERARATLDQPAHV